MRVRTRLVAVVAAPVLVAGLMLAGAAGSSPAVTGGSSFGSVKFTAVVIAGTSTVTMTSTSCTISETSVEIGKDDSCFLSGAGGLNNQGNLATANLAVTSSYGPITLSLSGLHSACGTGTGISVPPKGNPVPVVATIAGPVNPSKAGIVSGTIKLFNVGNKAVGCETASTTTTGATTTSGGAD